MVPAMPRLASAADVFNAIAEPQRRRIIGLLSDGERPVGEIVDRLRISQPLASKHLRVLRLVNVVQVRQAAQQRFYRLNAVALQPVHQWVGSFARFWQESFDRLDDYLAELQAADKTSKDSHAPRR
jgi:DNA-binding transcriptional ArsR family regulator